MTNDAIAIFRDYVPEAALFLAMALGYLAGKIRFGAVQLGGVCGTLIAALFIGQLGVQISPIVKNFFFVIFIFALGYSGGPQFFANLNAKGLRLGVFSLIEVALVLGLTLAAVRIFSFDAGTASGLVAGAATESAVIGTATEAIGRLPIDKAKIAEMQANVVTAYSITYVFGLITIVVFTSQIAPLLLRVDLRKEAEKLWKSMAGGNESNPSEEVMGRYFRVSLGAGKTVGEINGVFGGSTRIERVQHRGHTVDIRPELRLAAGDVVLMMGPNKHLVMAADIVGRETAYGGDLNMAIATEDFVLSNRELIGKNLSLIQMAAADLAAQNHAYLAGIVRGGHPMPIVPGLALAAGDVIRLSGDAHGIAKMGARIGRKVTALDHTNLLYAGIGIILGIVIGSLGFKAGGVYFSLGTGGGALLTGLVFGWFQSRHPSLPGIPPSGVEMMKDLGLATFIACVGLSAGPQALQLVKKYGIILPLVGICMAAIPAMASLLIGRFFLRLEAPVLLGGIAGQQCSTPALSAVQSAAGNTTPLLGYTISYAISNVLLPLLGPIIVGLCATG